MTQTELVEAMARAFCATGGMDPDFIMGNDGPRWRYYVPLVDAALPFLDQAHRAGEMAMRERIAGWLQQGGQPVGLLDQCGADELATAISALEAEGMGDG